MNLGLNKCRNLAIVSITCAGISLVIGGALLDTVGFIIGFLALSSARKHVAANASDIYAQNALKLCKIGVVLCLVACIANLLTAVFLAPAILGGNAPVTGSATF